MNGGVEKLATRQYSEKEKKRVNDMAWHGSMNFMI
jgi:hypothetical protein